MSGKSAYSGHRRSLDGVIVTVTDLDSGRTESRHFGGVMAHRRGSEHVRGPQQMEVGVTDLLRSLAVELDEREGDWRIRSVSSPSTILADMKRRQGRTVAMPEAIMLSKIDRLDLLERPMRFPKR